MCVPSLVEIAPGVPELSPDILPLSLSLSHTHTHTHTHIFIGIDRQVYVLTVWKPLQLRSLKI
jgi:hypothetical protein